MKKNIRLLYFVIASFAITSCDDAIDIVQPSELLPELTYTNVADLQLGLNGVYGAIPGESEILFTSLFTDEATIGRNNGGQGTDGELAFLLNSNTGDPASIWLGYYYAINAANRVLVGADAVLEDLEEGSADIATINDIIAQVRVVRAYSHLKLMSYFCPNLADDNALGVIALDYVPASTDTPARNTAGEVYALINSDLEYADANLVPVTNVLQRKKYITQYAILAIRARMAAYREQYAAAKEYVDTLDTTFNLTPVAAYANMFTTQLAANNEVIFALERVPAPATATIGNFYQFWASVNSTVDGSPFYEVGRALFNLYDATDIRRTVVVDPTAIIAPNYASLTYQQYLQQDVLPVGKYRSSDGAPLNGDILAFRFSEMVLIRAEYYASINDLTNVAAQVNSIRTARGAAVKPAPTTATAAWALILDERRAELAFEGHRYLDIKRIGVKAAKGVERDPQDCSFNNQCSLPASDYRFTLPIPLDELVANPSIVQNPGYGN
jgi:hypothetical protein